MTTAIAVRQIALVSNAALADTDGANAGRIKASRIGNARNRTTEGISTPGLAEAKSSKTLSIAAMYPDVQPDGREQKKCQDGGYDLHAPDPPRGASPDGQARQQHFEREFLHRLTLRRQASPGRTQPKNIMCVEMTRGFDLDQAKNAASLHFRARSRLISRDLLPALTVVIVALPLSMAIAVASEVSTFGLTLIEDLTVGIIAGCVLTATFALADHVMRSRRTEARP